MTQYLIDFAAGCFRPVWTDMDAVGFLVDYLDAHDTSPAEGQMTQGYENSAGFSPSLWPLEGTRVDDLDSVGSAKLYTPNDDEPMLEVSRCTSGDGSTVIMFQYAVTAVIRDDKVVWLARLD